MGSTTRATLKFLALLLAGAALLLGRPTDPQLNEDPPGDVAAVDDHPSAGVLPTLEASAMPEPVADDPTTCDPEHPVVPDPDRRLYATWRTFALNRAEHGVDGTLRVLNDSRFTGAGFERRGTHPVLPPCDKLPGKLEVVGRDGKVVDALDVSPETDVMAFTVAPGQTLFEVRELVQCIASCWCGDHERFLQVTDGHLRRLTTRSSKGDPLEVAGVTNGCYEAGSVVRAADGRFEVQIHRTTMPSFASTWVRHFWDGEAWRTAELPAKDRRDGTRAIVLSPLDLIARLCAMVPPPGFHMIRFHGVFAGHAADRADVVPRPEPDAEASVAPPKQLVLAGIGEEEDDDERAPSRKPWAWLLRHVFKIDVTVCPFCEGRMRWLEVATQPDDIARLLAREGLGPRPPPPPRARRRRRRPPFEQLALDLDLDVGIRT